MHKRALAAMITGAAMTLAACGGGSSGSTTAEAQSLLQQAKVAIDNAPALHFAVTTSGAPSSSGISIKSGEGDLQRPDKLRGSFTVSDGGLTAAVKVAAAGGKFYAELPFTSSFTQTNPGSFGVANPAQLISPTGGLSSILTDATNVMAAGETRLNGELLATITGSVPGSDITVLPDQNPSVPVAIKAEVDTSSHQLRQITLTGPIETKTPSSFIVTLTNYGENIQLGNPTA